MAFIKSLKHAFRGVLAVLKGERNARLHLVAAVAALALGIILGVSSAELAAIFFAALLVFLAEMTNTAIEKTLDVIKDKHDPRIGLIKDMTAGAVLVAAVGAVIIGAAIFWPYILGIIWQH